VSLQGSPQLDGLRGQRQSSAMEQAPRTRKVALCLFISLATGIVSARQSPPSATNFTLPNESATNAPVRRISADVFEIGQVRLDQRKRSITLPAVLDKDKGFMEYFLVTTYGKTHESILKTTAEPYHIHLAMLLLGANGPGNPEFPGSPTNGVPGPVINPSKDIIPGNKVTISVRWTTREGAVEHSAEELIYKRDAQSVMQRGSWVYNGSLMVNNKFLAQIDGSIISLVTDPVALINNTGPGHDNDMIWEPNSTNLPPSDLPVEVTISLQDLAPKP
jgi:hypothetical protein